MNDTVKNLLYQWCKDLYLGVSCNNLKSSDNDDCPDTTNSESGERQEYINLKNLENNILDETNIGRFKLLKNINRNKRNELISLLVLYLIGVLFGITFVYNYFKF